jgi:hypothetical protein
MVPAEPMKSIRLHIPAEILKSEIQDSMVLNIVVVAKSYQGVEGGREIQDSIAFCRGHIVNAGP